MALLRKIVSRLTHWKGRPAHTEPYTPFPAPAMPRVRIAVAGDVGKRGRHASAIAAAVARAGTERAYNVLLLLGDNVYPRGDPALLPTTVFEPYRPVLAAGATLLAILGNHDVMRGHGPEQLRRLGQAGPWWSHCVDGVLIVGLDSTRVDDATQRTWLEATLRDTDARWKIVAIHASPYSSGYQGSSRAVREAFVPLFERYGVRLVLSGHDHDYQRSHVINGVTYVVAGGASTTRRAGRAPFTAVSFKWHHFVDVSVFDDHLLLRAINAELRVGDTYALSLDR
ncbi:MAG TPA: metallophosphoesterase [Acidimicrobiia bacterium]|nr:metallophosphoesterase [Acidimicrobiia bacterium]